MTALGLLTFALLAVLALDVFGGTTVRYAIGRASPRRALLALLGSWAVVTTAGIALLHLLLPWLLATASSLLGGWASWTSAQGAVALVLVVSGALRLRAAGAAPDEEQPIHATNARGMAIGGVVLALTSLPDPAMLASVGLALQVESLGERVGLLIGWNVIAQLPMLALVAAGLLGIGPRAADGFGEGVARWRSAVLTGLGAVLIIVGLGLGMQAVLAGPDGTVVLERLVAP
ncbi:MAG: hypothetical protein Q4G40_08210 [Brachybacterium sp.]|nr:hypothetical protein [Brachybacterium sp.]